MSRHNQKKIFIDLGCQINKDAAKKFAFYCTLKKEFECFYFESTWSSAKEFEFHYTQDVRDIKDLKKYLNQIPEEFKKK